MYLETERLTLRLIQPSDVASLIDLWTDPEVTRYMGGPREWEKLEGIFEEELRNPSELTYNLWPVIEKTSGELVGDCGLLDKEIEDEIEIELVYVFVRSAWGNGYATEIALALREFAMGELKLNRLVSLIDPENTASKRVAEKVGMHLEKDVIRPGERVMHLCVVDLVGME